MSRRLNRGAIAALACSVVGLCAAAPAQATFHLNRIREIHVGNSGTGDYVELQATSAGQNFVGGQTITSYDNGGNPMNPPFTIPSNVANGANQATILIADSATVNGVTADFVYPTLNIAMGTSGGFLCYSSLDCVAWGMPGAGVTLGSPYGTPAVQSTGLSAGQTLVRSISRGCPTLFELSDDTNNSAADFSLGTANPRNNSSPIVEHACNGNGGGGNAPNTKLKKRPKNRSTDNSPTFKFTSTEAGSTFKCKLDHKPFRKCHSPKTYHGVKPGKHTFKVEAINQSGTVDPTPAKDKFTILP